MLAHSYDDAFFDWVDRSALRSASVMIPRIAAVISPRSVLDVGCGRGGWLRTWQAYGVARIFGVDGCYVDPSRLAIPAAAYQAVNLETGFALNERFDLVQCLEVGEHLRHEVASVLVESLVRHGDIALFSAAVPGQGGENHINEQEPEFWRQLFARHRFGMYDCIRPLLRDAKGIDPWYRYNSFIFAIDSAAERVGIDPTRIPASQPIRSYGSMSWHLRTSILRRLPVEWITLMSRTKYLVLNRLAGNQ